ncbi:MAG: YHS domain-containing protein [Deltaproteobacteria bacterium]
MAKDPICNMKVDETKAKYTSTYQGKTYYFCSADCKKAFDLNPALYAEKSDN